MNVEIQWFVSAHIYDVATETRVIIADIYELYEANLSVPLKDRAFAEDICNVAKAIRIRKESKFFFFVFEYHRERSYLISC